MRKFLAGFVAVVAIGAAVVATPGAADARGWGRGGWHGGWAYGGWGWGGPFIAGALIGGALAAPYYYAYGPYPYYYGYGPGYGPPGCVWRRYWNGYAWVRACY